MYVPRTCMHGAGRVWQPELGDTLMCARRENLNWGKTYYSIKYIVDHVLPVQPYRFIIKLDDDSYAHVPTLHSWMTQRKAQLGVTNVRNVPRTCPPARNYSMDGPLPLCALSCACRAPVTVVMCPSSALICLSRACHVSVICLLCACRTRAWRLALSTHPHSLPGDLRGGAQRGGPAHVPLRVLLRLVSSAGGSSDSPGG